MIFVLKKMRRIDFSSSLVMEFMLPACPRPSSVSILLNWVIENKIFIRLECLDFNAPINSIPFIHPHTISFYHIHFTFNVIRLILLISKRTLLPACIPCARSLPQQPFNYTCKRLNIMLLHRAILIYPLHPPPRSVLYNNELYF